MIADDENFRETIEGLNQLQEELNYKQARDSLRELVNNLDLNSEEREGLEKDIDSLSFLVDKLENSVLQIAVFGMVGRGKSSVLNALIGEDIFLTGALHGVTQNVDRVTWSIKQEIVNNQTINRVSSGGLGFSQVELLDTPGIDEINGEIREKLAHNIAQQVDLILFVIAGDITQVEYRALCQLRNEGKPMLVIFNKVDQYPETDRMAIYHKLKDDRLRELISPDEIVMVSAHPLITSARKNKQGKVEVSKERGQPQIEDLKLKILEILHREGKSLIALNSLLYADQINEQILEKKLELREDIANQIISRSTLLKSTVVALNPVTVLDLFTGAIIDVIMILSLSRLYHIPMTQNGAVQLLKNIMMAMGAMSLTEGLTNLGLSAVKMLLGITTPLTGGASLIPYISVATMQASISGLSAYLIGNVTKVYLENGAKWGEESPKTVVMRIVSSLDEESILKRIQDELLNKLKLESRSPIRKENTYSS